MKVAGKDTDVVKASKNEKPTGDYKVLTGKASILAGKKRIKKGDRLSSEEVDALPDNVKIHFVDDVTNVKTRTKVEEDDPQDGE